MIPCTHQPVSYTHLDVYKRQAFVRYSKKNMDEGAAKAGRNASKLILGCVIVGSIGRDSKKGKEGAREQAAMYLANKVQNIKGSADVLLESAGIAFDELQPVADAMEKGGRKAAAQAVSDELLRKVCPIAGTPEDVYKRQTQDTYRVGKTEGECLADVPWKFFNGGETRENARQGQR